MCIPCVVFILVHSLFRPLSLLVGVFLGMCSSFLGIGGGPINVALIIFLLSCPAKYGDGAFPGDGSLCPDFKDRHYRTGDGVRGLCLSIAPVMVVEAIAGGFICAGLNERFSEKAAERAFNGVQLLVLAITGIILYGIYNGKLGLSR